MAVVAEKERGRSQGVDGGGNSEKPGRNAELTPGLQKQRKTNFISVISPLSAGLPALFHLTLGDGPDTRCFF